MTLSHMLNDTQSTFNALCNVNYPFLMHCVKDQILLAVSKVHSLAYGLKVHYLFNMSHSAENSMLKITKLVQSHSHFFSTLVPP